MMPIALDVEQVVDQVIGRCHETEAEESCDHGAHGGRRKLVGEQQRDREKDILGPLMDARRFDEGTQGGSLLRKRGSDGDVLQLETETKPERGVGDHGVAGAGKQRKISPRVADVIEFAKSGSEAA